MIVALLIASGLMVADVLYHALPGVKRTLSTLVAPVHLVAGVPTAIGGWSSETLASRSALLEENRELRAQMLLVQAHTQRMASLTAENVRLRELLNSTELVRDEVLVAEVLTASPDPYRKEVVINKGADAGVQIGQSVLDAQGLMGQVVEVSALTSRVLLINDVKHALSVENLRNGIRTVAAGTGSADELDLLYLPDTADIRENDLLVSSGLGGVYPQGYPVARVTSVGQSSISGFKVVKARPTARLDRSRHVLLVIGADIQEALQAQASQAESASGGEQP